MTATIVIECDTRRCKVKIDGLHPDVNVLEILEADGWDRDPEFGDRCSACIARIDAETAPDPDVPEQSSDIPPPQIVDPSEAVRPCPRCDVPVFPARSSYSNRNSFANREAVVPYYTAEPWHCGYVCEYALLTSEGIKIMMLDWYINKSRWDGNQKLYRLHTCRKSDIALKKEKEVNS